MAKKPKFPKAERIRGFAEARYLLKLIAAFPDGKREIIEIPFKITPLRSPIATDAQAIAIAGLIFNVILNPAEQDALDKLTEALTEGVSNQIKALSLSDGLYRDDLLITGVMDYEKGKQVLKMWNKAPKHGKVLEVDPGCALELAIAG